MGKGGIRVVLIPGTTQLTSQDIAMRINKAGACAVIVGSEHQDQVDEIEKDCPQLKKKLLVSGSSPVRKGWLSWHDLCNNAPPEFDGPLTRADDPMTIFFTSGTTGSPKMTEHTQASYGLAHYITGKYWLDLTPNDTIWNLSDTGWAKAAYSNLFAPWIQGSCVYIHNSMGKFDPVHTMEILSKNSIDVFCGPPTAYRMMVLQNLSSFGGLRDVRHYVSAGEPLNPEVTDFWEDQVSHTIREGYGQTETVLLCGSFRCIPNKAGSMGKPSPGIPLKDEPERTAKPFVGDYYLTGDRAYQDEDGYFWFVGRDDDVILSAGYRIGPFEVESALIEHPAVAESAVVSSPDEVRGALVKAFIILTDEYKEKDPGVLRKDIQQHVKKVTAAYKYPRKIDFVSELPKTISGKIRRIELRQQEWNKGN